MIDPDLFRSRAVRVAPVNSSHAGTPRGYGARPRRHLPRVRVIVAGLAVAATGCAPGIALLGALGVSVYRNALPPDPVAGADFRVSFMTGFLPGES